MTTFTDFKNYIEKKANLDDKLTYRLYKKFFSNLTTTTKPKLIVLGGSPGAGKTTFRRQFLALPNYHVHDLDEVQMILPGYQLDLEQHGKEIAFEKWWPIAQKIANVLVRFAFEQGYNVIYDRTCGTEESYLDLKAIYELRRYSVVMYGFWVTEDVALARVQARTAKEPRTVTPAITKEYLARFSALWPLYLRIADEIRLLNNNDDGFDYSVIYQRINGEESVLDEGHYQQFRAAAKLINFTEKFPKLNNQTQSKDPNKYSFIANNLGAPIGNESRDEVEISKTRPLIRSKL